MAAAQALYNLQQNESPDSLAIVELHACYYPVGEGPCMDSYVPPDNTTTHRADFYDVCGYPDVYFDGDYSVCGAGSSVAQVQAQYASAISNASSVPGNASIAQIAYYAGGEVYDSLEATSAQTGPFWLVSYLAEYIGKTDVNVGSGDHSVGWVVRETLDDQELEFASGIPVQLNLSRPLNASWNVDNLSVVTLVQENGTRIVENANDTPVVNESAVRSRIQFQESGLPSGTLWTVVLNGTPLTSNSSVILSPPLPLGQYLFEPRAPGYYSSISSAYIELGASLATQVLFFAPDPTQLFPLSFRESGLPLGRSWGVLIGNQSRVSTSDNLSFTEPNGTYGFVLLTVPGYESSTIGPAVVNGSATIVPVTFQPQTYAVVFVEFGLPTGSNWSVTVSNASTGFNETKSSTASSITFFLPNGSYAIQFQLPSGYVGNASSTDLTVDGEAGAGPTVHAATPSIGSGNPPAALSPVSTSGPPPILWFALGAGAVVLIVAGLLATRRRFRGPPPEPDP